MTNDLVWLGVTAGLAVILVAISVVDLLSYRIPDFLSLPLVAAGLLLMWWQPQIAVTQTVFADHLIGASGAFLMFAGLGEVIYRRTGQEALGLGDAKLFAAAGAWLGWQALPVVLLIASVGGLVLALILRRRQWAAPIAFGPWIALGFMGVWLSAAIN